MVTCLLEKKRERERETQREGDQMKEPTHGETGPNGTVHLLSRNILCSTWRHAFKKHPTEGVADS